MYIGLICGAIVSLNSCCFLGCFLAVFFLLALYWISGVISSIFFMWLD